MWSDCLNSLYVNYVINKYNYVTFHQVINHTFTVDYKVPYGKRDNER